MERDNQQIDRLYEEIGGLEEETQQMHRKMEEHKKEAEEGIAAHSMDYEGVVGYIERYEGENKARLRVVKGVSGLGQKLN